MAASAGAPVTFDETRGIVYAVMVDCEWRDVEKTLLRRCALDLDFRWAMAVYGEAIFAELIEAKRATRH